MVQVFVTGPAFRLTFGQFGLGCNRTRRSNTQKYDCAKGQQGIVLFYWLKNWFVPFLPFVVQLHTQLSPNNSFDQLHRHLDPIRFGADLPADLARLLS